MTTTTQRFACMELMWGDVSGPKLEPWFDEIRSLGFTGVAMRRTTLWPFIDQPQRLLTMLAARGLSLVGTYATIDTPKEDLERFCSFLKTFDCRDLILHGGQRIGKAEREALAKLLEDRGAMATKHGIRLSFHHHTNVPFENYQETAEQLALTTPKHVHLFCDTGHATKDFSEFPLANRALELLKRHWDRISYIEYKDWCPATEFATELGKGNADLKAVTEFIKSRGFTGWIVLEQNEPATGSTPGQSAGRSLRYAQGLFAAASSKSATTR